MDPTFRRGDGIDESNFGVALTEDALRSLRKSAPGTLAADAIRTALLCGSTKGTGRRPVTGYAKEFWEEEAVPQAGQITPFWGTQWLHEKYS